MEYFQDVPENEKTVEAAWQYGLYDAMLNGHVPLRNIPKLMPTCARVYLSSVATDSECEREYLITNIYIKLREYCRAAHNIEFQALLGQRYCNEAIPPLSIPSDKHSAQREALLANNVDIRILERHYRLDENCQPAQFLLQPHLNDVDKWVETERKLSEMLMLAARLLDDSDWFNPPSDLQIEIDTGLFNVEKQKFRDDNCLLFRKKITNIEECLERKRASKFIDLYPATNEVDKAANSAMVNLRQTVESSVSPNNIFDFNIEWAEPAGIDSKEHKDYLISFGNTLFEQIRRHVDVCMIEWAHYPNNELYTEIQQHWLCTRSNLEHFYEQGQYLQAIENYVGSQSHAPIFVHGVSGCGKSSILSCIASNLCHVMGMSYVAPKTFLEAKLRFRNILEKGYCNCTLLLVIDGLDCLSTEGYDQIDWLPMKLSPNIKMVVSLRDLDPKNTLEKIQKKYTDSSCFLQVENMLPEICEWMLKKRLQETNRLVTSKQWSRISKGLHESPYPLYVELVFQQIIKWRSYDAPVLPHTVDGVIAKLLEILEDTHGYLATSHILSLLSSSMYGLSEAELEDILSIDDELLSVFASPETHSVLRVPCAVWSKLKLDLYPYLSVWKVDNVNLITWKYPQISKAVQKKYMSSEAFSRKIHNLVADFFLGKWSGIVRKPNKLVNDKQTKVISYSTVVRGSSHRNVISQPLVISGHGTQARVNVRKLNELAHHLAKANEIEDLKKEVLFNYDWLHTKLSAMPMSRLLADFDIYSDAEISLVRQALSDIKIEFDPDTLGMELSGRLMVYYSQHPNIKSLIDQCDLQSLQRCSAVPKLQLYQTPGSLLQHQFEERLHVTPTLQLSMVSKPDATYFVVKEEKWNYALLYNVSSHETTRLFGLPGEGLLYVTPNQEKIIAKRENRIESYQVDSQQLEFSVDTDKGSISCSAISDSYFVFSIKQKTGPYVVDLLYPSLIHRLKHHSTALAVSHDGEVMVCNDGQCLHVYELPLMTRHCSIPTDDTASKILFLSNSDTFIVLSSSHYVTMVR
ncbi:hypothetical protein EB796_002212 [Bugula neritina]|uniref:NWD1/2-like winged helix-turn-helix domain-containing protein n=1 Tax=Bugula neritina TaxID=10212 RepID=A0A7J7KMS5_BUGNE|nr:hypothetical protein EB796_002212 [Bugula neritina]